MKQDGETLKLLKHFETLGIPGLDCVVLYSDAVSAFFAISPDFPMKKKPDGSTEVNSSISIPAQN